MNSVVGTASKLVLAGFLTVAAASTALAQSSWDWGGEQTVGGAGKKVVRFASTARPGSITVSFSDRRLYLVTGNGEALSYPIAIPREQSRWQGVMTVTQKRENPSWTPTPTMRAENPRLPNWVPGGHPMNPLGVRALYLGSSAYRIHGTDAPWTIGQPVSKGCIRMFNQDVIDLYGRVQVGTVVNVTWQSFNGGTGGQPIAQKPDKPERRAYAEAGDEDRPRPTYRKVPRTRTTEQQ